MSRWSEAELLELLELPAHVEPTVSPADDAPSPAVGSWIEDEDLDLQEWTSEELTQALAMKAPADLLVGAVTTLAANQVETSKLLAECVHAVKLLAETSSQRQQVVVNLPTPVVTIKGVTVEVAVPKPKRIRKTLQRDAKGLITHVDEECFYE